jgi:type 1 glutamine amidotransferase
VHQIQLDADEFVTEMSGTIDKFDVNDDIVITSLRIVTNLQTFGPWGDGNGAPFTVPVQSGSGIVGFFGRSGAYLDAIGAYVRPI